MTTVRLHEDLAGIPDNVFSLAPPAFIDTWAAALGLSDGDLSQSDRAGLLSAIRNGTSRLKVIDALDRHRATPLKSVRTPESHGLRREPDGFALVEIFTHFAPDDDASFLRYAFSKICDRGPSERERLEFEFDLRRGLIDRASIVKRIVATAANEGRVALWDSMGGDPDAGPADTGDPSSARAMPAGLVYDEAGRETLIFIREIPAAGLVIAPDVMRQAPKTVDGGWAVNEGWLLVGPKRTFKPGPWRIDLDLVQSPDAIVDVDVVANSGLDVLQHIAICGSFFGSFRVEFRPEHRFCEFRVAVRASALNQAWIRPRNISMHRVA